MIESKCNKTHYEKADVKLPEDNIKKMMYNKQQVQNVKFVAYGYIRFFPKKACSTGQS